MSETNNIKSDLRVDAEVFESDWSALIKLKPIKANISPLKRKIDNVEWTRYEKEFFERNRKLFFE